MWFIDYVPWNLSIVSNNVDKPSPGWYIPNLGPQIPMMYSSGFNPFCCWLFSSSFFFCLSQHGLLKSATMCPSYAISTWLFVSWVWILDWYVLWSLCLSVHCILKIKIQDTNIYSVLLQNQIFLSIQHYKENLPTWFCRSSRLIKTLKYLFQCHCC